MAEQSIRDQAAKVLRQSTLAVWANMPDGNVPTELLHFIDNRVLRIEGTPEQIADALAAAGLLAAEPEAVNGCGACWRCDPGFQFMRVCPTCGNKRCPHANDHDNACTGSNESGQEGSAYPAPASLIELRARFADLPESPAGRFVDGAWTTLSPEATS